MWSRRNPPRRPILRIAPIYLLVANHNCHMPQEDLKKLVYPFAASGGFPPPSPRARFDLTCDPRQWGAINEPSFMHVIVQKLLASFPELQGYLASTPVGWEFDEQVMMSTAEAVTEFGRFRLINVTTAEEPTNESNEDLSPSASSSVPGSLLEDGQSLVGAIQHQRVLHAVDVLMAVGPTPQQVRDITKVKQIHVFTNRGYQQQQIHQILDMAVPVMLGPPCYKVPGVSIENHVYPSGMWPQIERYALEFLMSTRRITTQITQEQLGWAKGTDILVLTIF